MASPQDSIDTEQAPSDTTSHTVEERPPPPQRSGQFLEIADDHLDAALDTETPSEKNYHVREALQALAAVTEYRPD